jgi:hypothetical protein
LEGHLPAFAKSSICTDICASAISAISDRIALGVDDVARAERALKGIVGKRLTYRTTIHG